MTSDLPTASIRTWQHYHPKFLADERYPQGASSPWSGHRRFVYDLLAWRQPATIVELGTHYGVSLFAMAQAALDLGLTTQLHAVDTWEGEEHAGRYSSEVLDLVKATIDDHYRAVNITLHRQLFEEAVGSFADASVDIVHIDGFHSYDAARSDFETWVHTLAPNSIVLFHDVSQDSGYGSADYWDEISAAYPSQTFPHSFGLGLLFPTGTDGLEYLMSDEFDRWKHSYSDLYFAELATLQVRDMTEMIDARDEAITAQASMIEDRDAAIRDMTALIVGRDEAIDDQADRLEQRWAVIENQQVLLEEIRQAEIAARTESAALRAEVERLRVHPAIRAARATAARIIRAPQSRKIIQKIPPDLKRKAKVAAGLPVESMPPAQRAPRSSILGRFVDPEWYRAAYRDAQSDPISDYESRGVFEGRNPNAWADAASYANIHGVPGPRWLDYYMSRGMSAGDFLSPLHRGEVLEAARPPRVHDHWRRTISGVRLTTGTSQAHVPVESLGQNLPKFVTFDLWDTLVTRDRPADAAKVATARRILLRNKDLYANMSSFELAQQRVEIEAELARAHPCEEYHAEDVLAELCTRLNLDASADIVRSLVDDEASEEARHVAPISEIAGLLSAARTQGHLVRVISDFYLGSEHLRQILSGAGVEVHADEVVSSCEQGISKRMRGDLLVQERGSAGVDGAEHLHIGDNPIADEQAQLSTGGSAALIGLSECAFVGPGHYSLETLPETLNTLETQIRTDALEWLDLATQPTLDELARHAGQASALFPAALVYAAIEYATVHELEAVHYISREGLFLSQVHHVVAESLQSSVRAITLATSRKSTFGPSIADDLVNGLQRMWTMYGNQSISTLLQSIGVEQSPALLLDRYGLAPDVELVNIASDERVRSWLADEQVHAHLTNELRSQRDKLTEYLEQHLASDDQVLIVDVGWRGSIQDNLARVVPNRHFHGIYLGLFEYLNQQPTNCTKQAVAFDANLGDEFSYADPPAVIERPWTPDTPTTVAYERDQHGRIQAVVEPGESPTSAALIDAYQKGVLSVAGGVATRLSSLGLMVRDLAKGVGPQLRRHYVDPPLGVADIWFESSHDDSFGAANVSPYAKLRPTGAWLDADGEQAYEAAATQSRWPTGYKSWLTVRASRYVMDHLN